MKRMVGRLVHKCRTCLTRSSREFRLADSTQNQLLTWQRRYGKKTEQKRSCSGISAGQERYLFQRGLSFNSSCQEPVVGRRCKSSCTKTLASLSYYAQLLCTVLADERLESWENKQGADSESENGHSYKGSNRFYSRDISMKLGSK
jgi:hypothetical protein